MQFKKIYRYIIVAAFAILFCAETFYSVFLIADYYADTQAYAVHCINKNKPQMHCNGKCQLQKKIDDATNRGKQNTEKKNEAGFSTLSSKSFFASVQTPLSILVNKKYFNKNVGVPVDNTDQFFHPPQWLLM